MNANELVVNIQCVEHGIVPIAGVSLDHIEESLKSLSPEHRRRCVRKFRKLLKKAIKHKADEFYRPGTRHHGACVKDHRRLAGLDKEASRPFTRSESEFRRGLVARYLSCF